MQKADTVIRHHGVITTISQFTSLCVFAFQFSSVLSRILDGACVSYKAVDGDVFAHWSEDVQGHNAAF